MKKIITTALVSGLIALSFASAASASDRHHARRQVHRTTVGTNVDPRDSYAAFGVRGQAYNAGSDARVYGNALSPPAGR